MSKNALYLLCTNTDRQLDMKSIVPPKFCICNDADRICILTASTCWSCQLIRTQNIAAIVEERSATPLEIV